MPRRAIACDPVLADRLWLCSSSDAGDPGTRNIIVNQATTTTFNGMVLSHASTHAVNIVRNVYFEKQGAGTLTMANVLGTQTAASGVSNSLLTIKVTGGKLALTATNTFNTPLAVDSGATLELGGAGQLGSGTFAQPITNSGTLSVASSASQTLSGVISGTGVLTKPAAGTLTLSGANTYSGATTVSAGSLVGLTGGSVANSAVTVAAGATNGVQLAAANGQWTCAGLTYGAATAVADFNFGVNPASTTAAPLKVNGNLAFTGTRWSAFGAACSAQAAIR